MHRLKDSWGKAKLLLSQLLCIGAMFTACTDDDTIVQSDKAPLQISVSAKAPAVSRTIIDGSSLPDGSHIGVSVFDADGGEYDGQDYFNLKYTAFGEGEGQSWSTTTPASLSTTMAVVTAYFPYIDNDELDLTAVPVETASQTDYMYSGAVAGANMSSPEVTLNMSHALANIHVNIKKGTYTGTGEVSQMAVKAPAFATNATMNVFDGTLGNIDGKGAEFTQKITDAAISAGMVEQDFLVVPDGSSESGNISLSVTVDGKKFTAGIDYDEAFQQGYTYTYNLTLNNEDLKVEAVEVLPWGEKASFDERLDLYDDEYIVEIAVPSDNYEFVHNINGFVGTIDWGDGTTTEYTYSTSYPTHTFAAAGNYIVTAEGKMISISSYESKVSKIITKLVRIGKEMGVTSMVAAFQGQTLLESIIPGALDGCTEVTGFGAGNTRGCFNGCKNLRVVPDGLFDKCTENTNFANTFRGCTSLTSIPEGLFVYNTKVKYFGYAFYGCLGITEIPEGLFDKCTEVTDFSFAFRNCLNLNKIPKGLFDYNTKVTTFESTFLYTNITEIPEGLFDKCTEVTDFSDAFGYCTKLQSIPRGLFDSCTEVTDFFGVFGGCKSLTSIPEGLFDKCTEVTSFYWAFYQCGKITTIPVGLFDYNTKVTNFRETFGCTGITEIPEGLFDNCPEVTNFNGTFYGCKNLTSIPEGLFDYNTKVTTFESAFNGCSNLQEIPVGLFDKCTKVTSFYNTFMETAITEIPEGLFDKCTVVKDLRNTFYKCKNLSEIPKVLFDKCKEVTSFEGTFAGCSSLTEIPEGLFDNCTKVEKFGYSSLSSSGIFANCTNLKTIPIELFDKCTKVTDFGYAFSQCINIEGESPYTIIKVDGVDIKVHLYERADHPEYFTAPTKYSKCYNGCTKVTDYSSIPSDWK